MTEKGDQVEYTLPISTGTIKDVNLSWLLLCSQKNKEQKILCLRLNEKDTGLLQSLLKSFTEVSSCFFEKISDTTGKSPSNAFLGHSGKDKLVLPYDSDLFDIVVISNYHTSRRLSVGFFSEIHRVLHSQGCLFFCFPNRLSYQRVKQLLQFSNNIKKRDDADVSFLQSVLSCKNLLTKSGFSLPHFYTFSPSCNKPTEIRDCNKASHHAYLNRPFFNLKSFCVQFLKKSWMIRDYFAMHYGVVASKRNVIDTIPSLIARDMTREFHGTSWQVLGDTFDVTGKGTFVFKLYDKKNQKAAICKIPLNQETIKHLEANYFALEKNHANQALAVDVKNKVPCVIAKSEINGYLYFVEELKHGGSAVQYRYDKKVYDDILFEASTLISALHNSTSVENKTIGKDLIKNKLQLLKRFIGTDIVFIINLEKFLQDSFHDHVLFVASKGDCSANNIIINFKKEISGIIDWDQARKISFPMIDIINLIESFRRNLEEKSMGQVVIELFLEGKRSDLENSILKEYCSCLSFSVDDFIPFAVLYWVDHIIAQDYFSVCKDKTWMQNNIILVVNALKMYI